MFNRKTQKNDSQNPVIDAATTERFDAAAKRLVSTLFKGIPHDLNDTVAYGKLTTRLFSDARILQRQEYLSLVEDEKDRLLQQLIARNISDPDRIPMLDGQTLDDASMKLLYSYRYWSDLLTKKEKAVALKSCWRSGVPEVQIKHVCEACGTNYQLKYSKKGLTSYTECPSCAHNGRDSCRCNRCCEKTPQAKENILDFIRELAVFISQNMDAYNVLWGEEVRHAATPSLSESDRFLAARKHQFSSLDSDERCFLDTYIEAQDKNVTLSVGEVIKNVPAKNPHRLLKNLRQHGVIYEKGVDLPSLEALERDLLCVILEAVRVSYRTERSCSYGSLACLASKPGVSPPATMEDLASIVKFEGLSLFNSRFDGDYISRVVLRTLARQSAPLYPEWVVNEAYLPESRHRPSRSLGASKVVKPGLVSVFKSPHEEQCYQTVIRMYPGKCVLPNYPMRHLIRKEVLAGAFSESERAYLLSCYVDFAVCGANGFLEAAVEVQIGKHHNNPEYIAKDHLKKRLCSDLEVEYFELHGCFDKNYMN